MACGGVGTPVNNYCRFCNKNLMSHGALSNSANIFARRRQETSVFERLAVLGLKLRNVQEKSMRTCKSCINAIGRLERDLIAFKRWQLEEEMEETGEMATTSAPIPIKSEKIEHTPPPESPRTFENTYQNPQTDTRASVQECHINSNCQVTPIVRHVASQTDPPDFEYPKMKSVGTQLSMKTLQNHFRSTATQVKVTSRDYGVCTVTLPMNSPMLFLQPTLVKRPSKRPRLSLPEEDEGPSESSMSAVVHEPEDST